jgi:Leucine-rich repeat (LRR) protein
MSFQRLLRGLLIAAILTAQTLFTPAAQAAAFINCAGQHEIPTAECDALVALYNATDGSHWLNHSNWLVSVTPSNWYGVTVAGGHVLALDLSSNNLYGSIPSALGDLSRLQILNFNNSQIIGAIPPSLGNLTHLTHLYLASTSLISTIPAELSHLSELLVLDVHLSWRIYGQIPPSLSALRKLGILYTQGTQACEPNDAAFQAWKTTVSIWATPGMCVSLSGHVTQAGGPLPGAQITIVALDFITTQSGADGFYSLDLIPGSYTLEASLSGRLFKPDQRPITLTDTNLSGLDFFAPAPFGGCAQMTEVPPAECLALQALYNSTGGPNWTTRTRWLTSDEPSSWYGVTVSAGHVSGLNLANANLVGSIPPQLANLTQLQTLNLSSNQLTGAIPPELGSLANLETLDLGSNPLKGSFPPQLGSLSKLKSLVLNNLNLYGEIPPEWAQLTNLEQLNLSYNFLYGVFPTWLSSLPHLTSLDLSHTSVNGLLPSDLGNLVKLQTLKLNDTYLMGGLPLSLPALTQLARLDVSKSSLCEPRDASFQSWKATIPTWASPGLCYAISGHVHQPGGPLPGATISPDPVYPQGSVTTRSTLSAADGAYTLENLLPGAYTLSVSLPGRAFAPWKMDVTLLDADLPGQDFTALPPFNGCGAQSEIPTSECDVLTALYSNTNGPNWIRYPDPVTWLATDQLSQWNGVIITAGHVTGLNLFRFNLNGAIPPELANLAALQSLDLNFNSLSGGIPPELGSLVNLQQLILSGNQLSGSIPPELGSLPNLTNLSLSGNLLSGSIPPQLGQLSNLQELFLSNTQLTGNIPSELGQLNHLTNLDLSGNQLSGSIPPQLGQLSSLQELFLSYNQLTGNIPPELGQLTRLTRLFIFDNQLTGPIPAQLQNLSHLRFLDLSNNHLNGAIPAELGALVQLQFLNLSNNHLKGDVPASFVNLVNLYDSGYGQKFYTLFLDRNRLNHPVSDPALAAYLATYSQNWELSQKPGLIHGQVTDAAGAPLANVPVWLNIADYPPYRCTNQNGEYWFNADYAVPYRAWAGSLGLSYCGLPHIKYWPLYWNQSANPQQAAPILLNSAAPIQTNINFTLAPAPQVFTFYFPLGRRYP